jgi:hypothetical protein
MAKTNRHAAAEPKLRERAGYWARLVAHVVEEVWGDSVARWCGLTAVAFLWLTAALTEPAFAPLAIAAVASVCFRLKHKPEEPTDELF